MSITQGDWLVSDPVSVDGAFDYAIYVYADGRRQIIAETFGRSDWEHPHDSLDHALLFAAAPDLLAAAKCAANVLALLDKEVSTLGLRAGNVRPMLLAAIAKAQP